MKRIMPEPIAWTNSSMNMSCTQSWLIALKWMSIWEAKRIFRRRISCPRSNCYSRILKMNNWKLILIVYHRHWPTPLSMSRCGWSMRSLSLTLSWRPLKRDMSWRREEVPATKSALMILKNLTICKMINSQSALSSCQKTSRHVVSRT